MTTTPDAPTDVEEMLRTMEAHIRTFESMPQSSLGAIANARDTLGSLRQEPFGGRLLWLKRIVFRLTASTFDRQVKAHESVLDALDEIGRELVDLRNRIAVLRLEMGHAAARLRREAESRAATEDGAPPERALEAGRGRR